ncbi:hypothetical protein WMY93_010873 [Mugilogobius chulae]|uniref:Protein FRA10AC1 n=1 Tax=Mugilogobius chulae TaxID=88201 RepID=A0AAW0PCF7_9GOBI
MDNLVKVHGSGGYDSDFSDEDDQGESSEKKLKREEARNRRAHLISLNAFERHKKFVSDYILYYGGQMADFKRSAAKDKTDYDVIRENHRFLWKEEDEEEMTWEKDLAKKYYDKLFKEYCIADLSRYKENKMLNENQHVMGKCQFQCGHKRCDKQDGLKSWEVNFAYVEQGEKRNALVKLRLCPECSFKLNYHHKRKEVQAKTKTKKVSEENRAPPKKKRKKKHSRSERHKHKKRRDHSPYSSSSDASSDKGSIHNSLTLSHSSTSSASGLQHWPNHHPLPQPIAPRHSPSFNTEKQHASKAMWVIVLH